jgi:hypothetical protein
MLKHETSEPPGVFYGEQTQEWRYSKPREHMAVMGKERKKEFNALKKAGWKPFMVTWVQLTTGDPGDLNMETPEWWTRVRRNRAVQGIWLKKDGAAIYYQLLERWVWSVNVQGAALQKVGNPFSARTLIQ